MASSSRHPPHGGPHPGAQVTPSLAEFNNSLTAEDRTQINEAFELFDNNSDGRLDYYEFRFALRALGFDLPKQETYAFLTKYGVPDPTRDPKSSDPVWWQFTLPIFQGIAGQLVARRDPTETFKQAFRLFDVDEKGIITVDDLRRVMNEIGRELSDRELAGMISEFDLNAKGGVSEEEFVKIMEKK